MSDAKPGGTIGNNMFAYCGNNPCNRGDSSGYFWEWVVAAVIGVVIAITSSGCSRLFILHMDK